MSNIRKKFNKTSKILVVLTMAMLLFVGCGKKEEVEEEDLSYTPVEVVETSKGNLKEERTYTGKVIADKEVMVVSKAMGTVETLNVKLGQAVKEGQTLFVVEQDDIRKNIQQAQLGVEAASSGVRQAESSIGSAKVSLNTAKENAENAKLNLERNQTLYEEGAVSKSQLEQMELSYSSANSQYESAKTGVVQAEIGLEQSRNQLNQAKLSLSQAQDALDNTIVKAPISGVITTLNVKRGQIVTSSELAAMIVDPNDLYIELDVAENIVNKLKVGQEVEAIVSAASEESVKSKIDYISSTADPQSKLYLVKVKINNKGNLIKPGMSSDVILGTEEIKDIIFINRDAILKDADENSYVYITDGEKAIKKIVEEGKTLDDFTEIKSGIEIGDKLIIKGQHYIEDGSLVKIVGGEEE